MYLYMYRHLPLSLYILHMYMKTHVIACVHCIVGCFQCCQKLGNVVRKCCCSHHLAVWEVSPGWHENNRKARHRPRLSVQAGRPITALQAQRLASHHGTPVVEAKPILFFLGEWERRSENGNATCVKLLLKAGAILEADDAVRIILAHSVTIFEAYSCELVLNEIHVSWT